MDEMMERMADLERRVRVLEDRTRRAFWAEAEWRRDKADELVRNHGDHVSKKKAAELLGVTRATVYAMLADGRVEGACGGTKVDVRSIAEYLASPKK